MPEQPRGDQADHAGCEQGRGGHGQGLSLHVWGYVEPFVKIFGGTIIKQVRSIQGGIREHDLNEGSVKRNKHNSGDEE